MNNNLAFKKIIDSVDEIIGIQYPDHTIDMYNQAGYDYLDLSKEKVVGKKCYELIGRDSECDICAAKQTLKSKKLESVEKYIPEKDTYIKSITAPIFDENGDIIRIIECIKNIAYQESREEIEQLKELLDKLVNKSPGMTYQFKLLPDDSYTFPYISEGIKELLGISYKETKDNPDKALSYVHNKDYDRIVQELNKSAKNLSVWSEELRIILPDQNVRWIESIAMPEKLDDESIIWHGNIYDITKRKTQELKIKELNKVAVEFHEINNEKEICEKTLNSAKNILSLDLSSIRLAKDDKLVAIATSDKIKLQDVSIDHGILGKAYKNNQSYLTIDSAKEPDANPIKNSYKSAITIPIGGIGVFQAVSLQKNAFNRRDLELAEILIASTKSALNRVYSQQKIKDKNLLFSSTLESIQDGIIVLDSDFRIRYANSKIKEWYSLDKSLIGENCYQVLKDSETRCESCPSEESFKSGRVEKTITSIEQSNQTKQLEVYSYPMLDDNNNIHGSVSFYRDITEYLKQKKLLEMNKFFVDNADLLILRVSPEGKVEYANQTALTKLNYSKEEFIGSSVANFIFTEEFVPRNKFWNKIKEEGSITYERNFIKKDGSSFPVEITSQYFSYKDQEHEFVFIQDISKRKASEFKLLKTKERLDQEINNAKDLHEKRLPISLPKLNGLDIYAYYKPANEIGGDFYNFIKLSDNKLLYYIIDITGHGLDAAMMSSFVKSTINTYVKLLPADKVPDPKELLKFIYEQNLEENFPDDYFVTINLGIIDTEENQMVYSSAGSHIPPVIFNEAVKELPAGNLPISKMISSDAIDYKNVKVDLSSGSIIFLSTDGLSEQTNTKARYSDQYNEIISQNTHMSIEKIAEALNKDFASFCDGDNDDDITYLIFKIT
ncbi:PAS domain-containing protein [Halanaerobiaceae bacterium Z-7014]|uniref:PAS domain-containing protein n=1 Tax=Halonatronomonas betaini TaxID=2778430 RepID=A0A931APV2_9FIRM|nr:PAS domain-containing protein [Halonatronomonas betaini]MBF8435844.1 PAS domain-containing protein [Halonatronomonas betaini]